jgi:hypothetical protein
VQDSHRGIKITSRATGTVLSVKRKSPDEGHRTLGFQISGDIKCTAQKKATKEKAISKAAPYGEVKWHGRQLIFHAELGLWDPHHNTDMKRVKTYSSPS